MRSIILDIHCNNLVYNTPLWQREALEINFQLDVDP